MSINEHHLNVTRTARYYTYGELSPKTRHIWFVCHGYGQSAARFIRSFRCLPADTHYVVAPEALSRFYWNGFTGPIVASWMTAEDRLNEIKDYTNYLDQLYQQIVEVLPTNNYTINVLGFSQGATTVSRWIGQGQAKPNRVLFWAGAIAHDLDWAVANKKLQQTELYLCIGTNDEIIKAPQIEAQKQLLQKQQVPFKLTLFDGKHAIHQPTLLALLADWETPSLMS